MSENTIYQSISIVLDPEIIKKLDEGNFNKSKLIDSLLNEYFNKDWNTIQKHPKLLWQLLCMCSYDGKKLFYHEWIGNKKKTGKSNNKKIAFLADFYPNKKMVDIEILASIITDKELKSLAKDCGLTETEIKKALK